MTVLTVAPRKEWANPEEVAKHLKEVNRRADEQGFASVVTVGELPDGSIYTGSSRTEDKFRVAAALIMFALELMGVKSTK